ncbi:MAG: hypothetical protein JO115_12140 [Pseudonocardiales bacterium]|nr:hypothetical protein [Pseudonocardiales bacterium]
MPVIPTRFPVDVGDVVPAGVFILGGESMLEFFDDRNAPTMPGFPYAPAEFEGLTITPYVTAKGRGAFSFRATGLRAPTGTTGSTTAPPRADATVTNAA